MPDTTTRLIKNLLIMTFRLANQSVAKFCCIIGAVEAFGSPNNLFLKTVRSLTSSETLYELKLSKSYKHLNTEQRETETETETERQREDQREIEREITKGLPFG